MTIIQPPAHPCFPRQQQEHTDHLASASTTPATLPDLTTLSTLWMPLDATIQAWASFGKEVPTFSALLAVGMAFQGLAWETKALRHYEWAAQERERGRWCKVVFWLRKAVEDLDCAIDFWYQALSWLHLAGDDDQQQDPSSLDTIRLLESRAGEHQERRRALSRQIAQDYATAKEHCQQRRQEGLPR